MRRSWRSWPSGRTGPLSQLTTAVAISAAELAEIKKKLEALTGKQVDINARVDASLIGGAKARIGSVIYDGTIKNQLNKMRHQLTNNSQ